MRFKWEVLRNCPSHWLDEREKAKKVSITNSMFYSRFEWDYLGCIKYLILSTRLLCDFASVRFISFFFLLSLFFSAPYHIFINHPVLYDTWLAQNIHTQKLARWVCGCANVFLAKQRHSELLRVILMGHTSILFKSRNQL